MPAHIYCWRLAESDITVTPSVTFEYLSTEYIGDIITWLT